jgi:hypothetical protein
MLLNLLGFVGAGPKLIVIVNLGGVLALGLVGRGVTFVL